MKTLTIIFFGAAVLLNSIFAAAQTNFYAVANIPETSTLILRAWPSQVSQALSNIPYNATQLETTGRSILLDKTNWVQVIYQHSVGWVEDSYLQPQLVKIDPIESRVNIENGKQVIDTAEVFSYQSPAIPLPKDTTKPNYPWSAAADTIYHDPKVPQPTQPKNTASLYSPLPATAPEVVTRQPSNNTAMDYREENLSVNRYEAMETISAISPFNY